MKFLIQKIDKKIVHDFSFVLLQAIDFRNWFNSLDKIKIKYFNTTSEQKEFVFEPIHRDYTPIGTVEFVSAFLLQFYNLTPKPLNVPEELFKYAERGIFNGTEKDFPKHKKAFIKSNDKIKGSCGIFNQTETRYLPAGEYQFSEVINIDSEWRAFVYEGRLVGLQNYCGEFTKFPNVDTINNMIKAYKFAPIAYTLDIGVNDNYTFVIECHLMMSVGLYGMANLAILPQMFNRAFKEYTLNKNQ
jgi:hypothetical protein